jgi:hypothetical protein
MRLREFMMGTVFMSITLVSVKALPPARDPAWTEPGAGMSLPAAGIPLPVTSMPLPAAPSPLIAEDQVLGSAYYDTLSILSEDNACSDFFGGSKASVDVFNNLIGKVRKDHFSTSVGMRMSGHTTNVFNFATKSQYRFFERVTLNTNGAFYRKRISNQHPDVPGVGSFQPNTKEVRVLIFLHELGHVIRGQDGKWLLPNDGGSENLSQRNSQKVEEVCGKEIMSLGKTQPPVDQPEQPAESSAPATDSLKTIN